MKEVLVVRALIERFKGRMIYTLRDSKDFAGGLLCLPGGKIDAGENHLDALIREVEEEVGITEDLDFRYLFSQPPVEHNGKLYRQDYFHTVSEAPLKQGEDVVGLRAYWPRDALLHPDITFDNAVAHHLFEEMSKTRMWVPEWTRANLVFQETGSIPSPKVHAPGYNPISDPRALGEWMRDNDPNISEQRIHPLDNWMLRHGLASKDEIATAEQLRARRRDEMRGLYQAKAHGDAELPSYLIGQGQ